VLFPFRFLGYRYTVEVMPDLNSLPPSPRHLAPAKPPSSGSLAARVGASANISRDVPASAPVVGRSSFRPSILGDRVTQGASLSGLLDTDTLEHERGITITGAATDFRSAPLQDHRLIEADEPFSSLDQDVARDVAQLLDRLAIASQRAQAIIRCAVDGSVEQGQSLIASASPRLIEELRAFGIDRNFFSERRR
jgi:hypothetical protein